MLFGKDAKTKVKMLAPNPYEVIKIEEVSRYDIGKTMHKHVRYIYASGRTEMVHLLIPIWDESDLPPPLGNLKKAYQ